MFNNSTLQQLYRVSATACLCVALSGCPSASNPTQPEQLQTPPSNSTPPPQSISSQPPQRSPATASEAASGRYSSSTGMPAGNGGPLTSEEEVAILDAQLEKGAAEFDTIIMKTQVQQREAVKRPPTMIASANDDDNAGQDNIADEDNIADAGNYSSDEVIYDEYAAPGDIPNGSGDSLAARQLRELAVREPDPAIRARLWNEYRKLKGIKN